MEKSDERVSLYLIGGGGLTKIGVSRNVTQRLRALQSSSPMHLVVLATKKYNHPKEAYSIESELYARFKDKRGHGEWFDLTDRDINTILVEYNFTQNGT